MNACSTRAGIVSGVSFSRVTGPILCTTWPSAERIVRVPGRLNWVMPRASGSRLSNPATRAAWPQATPPPIRAASTPTPTRLVRRVGLAVRLTSGNEGAVADSQSRHQHAQHQEGLGTGLVFHIEGHRIAEQPDVLEGDLGNDQQH